MAFGALDPDQPELVALRALDRMNVNHAPVAASNRTGSVLGGGMLFGMGIVCHTSRGISV
jgi:hypothetical protein